MDYIYYILAILVIGLVCTNAVRFVTRSQNPDLVLHYQARKKAARQLAADLATDKTDQISEPAFPPIKSLGQRHHARLHNLTPWGWPGADRQSARRQGFSEAMRNFTDRLVREKQLVKTDDASSNGSIRALLEDRYGPVDRGMQEIQYRKVKRPLLRDPTEQHDQLDNLGSVESRQLRKKLQFLSAMNNEDAEQGKVKGAKRVEFRYVELKDLKQPWGW